ncbi:MAG: hypothetical protein KAG64_04095 [Bacteroidales bacterium]|nr:hypothetical protein [Bacteroidales bacterium]
MKKYKIFSFLALFITILVSTSCEKEEAKEEEKDKPLVGDCVVKTQHFDDSYYAQNKTPFGCVQDKLIVLF